MSAVGLTVSRSAWDTLPDDPGALDADSLLSRAESGSWALFAIQDNGNGQSSPDKVISDTGNIPSLVPLEVIKQILMLPPPDGPPMPYIWFPIAGGNFKIH
jgi:hypothetical protein